jgi:hypothetical protein
MQDDRPLDSGKVTMVAGDTAIEHPPSDEVIELIREAMRRDRGKYVAVGLCYDVRVRTTPDSVTDAVCVSLEHEGGMAVDVVEPYAKRANNVEYGPLAAQQGRRVVFSSPP